MPFARLKVTSKKLTIFLLASIVIFRLFDLKILVIFCLIFSKQLSLSNLIRLKLVSMRLTVIHCNLPDECDHVMIIRNKFVATNNEFLCFKVLIQLLIIAP